MPPAPGGESAGGHAHAWHKVSIVAVVAAAQHIEARQKRAQVPGPSAELRRIPDSQFLRLTRFRVTTAAGIGADALDAFPPGRGGAERVLEMRRMGAVYHLVGSCVARSAPPRPISASASVP